ncbi:MAG: tetratricopeptide repeat protein [Ignavibacteriales bacterium]|nr:tetratricopeptide repeat protein [Ignavibacteriales bacterium]
MNGSNENLSKDLEQRITKAKKEAFEDASSRIEADIMERANNLFSAHKLREEQEYKSKLRNITAEREAEENKIRTVAEEFIERIKKELRNKIEIRLKQEEEERRRVEEEQRKQEEARLRQLEEEAKHQREELEAKRAEEERRRMEEELKKQEEERQKRLAEEQKRIEEEERQREMLQKQREAERKLKDAEKDARVKSLIANANEYIKAGNLELAKVEIAKALVNDPHNTEAREIEARIKPAKVETPAVLAEEIKEKQKPTDNEKKITDPVTQQESRKRLSPKYLIAAIVIVSILAIIIIFQMKKYVLTLPVKIAVMPWIDKDKTIEENVLGTALAEEVADKFSSVSSSPVMGFGSAYQLMHKTSLPQQEVFRLGFTYALRGKLQRAGSNFVLELELTDSLGKMAWTTKFPTSSTGLSLLPGEITKQISEVLGLPVSTDESNKKIQNTSKNPDSYSFYLRCREMLNRQTPETIKNAYDLILQAIQEDPKFAEGLALAAEIIAIQLENGISYGDSIFYRGKNLADAAIEANPRLDLGYVAQGKILAFSKNYSRALISFDTALALTQNNISAWFEKGKIALKLGKTQEALDALNRAYQLDPCNPELLKTCAEAYQLADKPKIAMAFHDNAAKFSFDSLSYLTGPVSDAILVDPELRLSQSQRILSASEKRMIISQNDYHSLYNYARLKQVMGHLDADKLLKKLEEILQEIIRKSPKDARAIVYLALAETRLGKFPEGVSIAQRAMLIAPNDAIVKYKVAQMFSLQMYSQKEKRFDEKKKTEAARYLREAISLNFKIDEIVNADFFNMFDRPEYKTAIQDRGR